jgi:hypothetical protein
VTSLLNGPRHRYDHDELDLEPGRWRPGTITSLAIAVLLVIGAVSVVLFGRDSTPTAGAVAGHRVATGPAQASPGAGEIPEPARVTPAPPLLTAPVVRWELFAGVALPYSTTVGPLRVDGPVYRGYARTQTGALIAAAQLGTRYLLTPGDDWRQVLEAQVLPSTGRDVYARARAGVVLDDPPGTFGQLAGFRVLAYTPDVAVLQLVTRFAVTGRLQVTTTTVMWAGGDWRLQLQPDGGSSPTAQAVPNLDGFVVWGGA